MNPDQHLALLALLADLRLQIGEQAARIAELQAELGEKNGPLGREET